MCSYLSPEGPAPTPRGRVTKIFASSSRTRPYGRRGRASSQRSRRRSSSSRSGSSSSGCRAGGSGRRRVAALGGSKEVQLRRRDRGAARIGRRQEVSDPLDVLDKRRRDPLPDGDAPAAGGAGRRREQLQPERRGGAHARQRRRRRAAERGAAPQALRRSAAFDAVNGLRSRRGVLAVGGIAGGPRYHYGIGAGRAARLMPSSRAVPTRP